MAVGTGSESAKRKRGDSTDDKNTNSSVSSVPALPATVDERIQGDAQSKRKWTRLLLRELYDLGYAQAAACLEREASVRVRSSGMETLQKLVMTHQWDNALQFLDEQQSASSDSRDATTTTTTTPRLQMQSRAAAKKLSLLLLKRKYVDLLLHEKLHEALETFQRQILPSFDLSEDEIQELAVLLLCRDQPQMEPLVQLPLNDVKLLESIEELVSPDEVVPHGSLRRMVQWNDSAKTPVVSFAQVERVDLTCVALLLEHTHEVLDVAFAPDGNHLATVARDGKIIIWALTFSQKEHEKTGETTLALVTTAIQVLQCVDGAPTCIAWSPDSQRLLSGGGDDCNVIQIWNPTTGCRGRRFQHPAKSVACVSWLPDGNHFLSGSVEKTLLLWNVNDGGIAYQWSGRRALDMAVHPSGDRVFVLCSETELREYNLVDKSDRLLLRADHLIASMTLSPTSAEFILLSFIEHEEIACLDVASDTIVSRQRGFKQQRFVLRPCFAGVQNELVVAGSEDGSVHVWRQGDGAAVGKASLHSSVVNVVEAHPIHRTVVASVSDDETVRLWQIQGG